MPTAVTEPITKRELRQFISAEVGFNYTSGKLKKDQLEEICYYFNIDPSTITLVGSYDVYHLVNRLAGKAGIHVEDPIRRARSGFTKAQLMALARTIEEHEPNEKPSKQELAEYLQSQDDYFTESLAKQEANRILRQNHLPFDLDDVEINHKVYATVDR